MTEFSWDSPYTSSRTPVLAANVVNTSQPLAAQAGMRMFQRGGNAMDAALATAIALVVVEPVSNGLGSDSFALVWDGKQAHGLNASGRAPSAWSGSVVDRWTSIPYRGWGSVTIPGAVAAWADLSERYGRLPFATLFEPAIEYATNGFPVSPSVALRWRNQATALVEQPGFRDTFMPTGATPAAGEVFRYAHLGRSLQLIADSAGRAFYEGELADKMIAHARAHGGLISAADLADHRSTWCEPIGMDFHGHRVLQLPPNGAGVVPLAALGMLASFDPQDLVVDTANAYHLQIEALKLAFADAQRYLADAGSHEASPAQLLDPDYLRQRASLIQMSRAQTFSAGEPPGRGTVYIATGDADGMAISLIQSNFDGFGSGVVVPGTDISLQNRAGSFTLEQGHPNRPGPGKRPLHSIMPSMVTRAGEIAMCMGVTGGNMQPQGQVQLALRILAQGQNPQAAIDAPRFRFVRGRELNLERSVAPHIAEELARRDHQIAPLPDGYMDFGSAQIAYRMPECWLGATDVRKDGAAVGC